METESRCLKCGGLLSSPAGQEYCPACLYAQAQASWADAEPTGDRQRPGRASVAADDIAGTRFGDYELLERIGQGGMGVVYKARQLSLDRVVALKMLPPALTQSRPDFIKRFQAEATAAGSLQHPHIVAIHEVGIHEGQHFFVMDFVAGQNLAQLAGHQPMPARRAARYLQTIAEAVHYAHERGILHRDLKPSNILIDAEDQPRIADFGLAKRLGTDSELTLTGQVLGSPQYIAPEQARGLTQVLDRQSDVYGLGAILYHLLTGRPPFVSDDPAETLFQVLHSEPVAPRLLHPVVPQDLQTICLKCLEKDLTRRYPTAQSLAQELNRFLEGKPILARPVGPAAKLWRWCRRQPARAALTGALVLACAAGVTGILWQWRRAKASEAFTRHNLYAADINLAQQALAEQNVGLALKLLEAYRPKRGEPDLRGWEWRYFWKQCQGDELLTLGKHELSCQHVSFSPDAKFLASAGQEAVILWDLSSHQEVARVVHSTNRQGIGRCMAIFSPVDRRFATSGFDNTVKLWEYPNVRHVATLDHEGSVLDCALSADGKTLAVLTTPSHAKPGGLTKLHLWDFGTGQQRESCVIQDANCLASSPDNALYAVGTRNGQIILWDSAARAARGTIQAHNQPVFKVRFAPGGHRVASTTIPPWLGEGVKVWDTASFQMVSRFTNHTGWIPNLAFAPAGRQVASASTDRVIKLWDGDTGQELASLQGHLEEVWGVAFSADGQLLASSSKDGEVKLWRSVPERQPTAFKQLPSSLRAFSLSPTADTLLLTMTSSILCIWDTATLTERGRYRLPLTNVCHAAISAGGRLAASGTTAGRIAVWRVEPGEVKLLHSLVGHPRDITGLVFSPDTTRLASCDSQGSVAVWELSAGRELARWVPTSVPVVNLRFGADNTLLAVSRATWEVEVQDLVLRQRHGLCEGHKGLVTDMSISRGGNLMATASEDAKAKLWDLKRRKEIATLEGQRFGLYSVALSPDEELLAVGGAEGSVKLWDVSLRRSLGSLRHKAQPGIVSGLGFSTDGDRLVSVSEEAIVIWQAASWAETERAANLHKVTSTLPPRR